MGFYENHDPPLSLRKWLHGQGITVAWKDADGFLHEASDEEIDQLPAGLLSLAFTLMGGEVRAA